MFQVAKVLSDASEVPSQQSSNQRMPEFLIPTTLQECKDEHTYVKMKVFQLSGDVMDTFCVPVQCTWQALAASWRMYNASYSLIPPPGTRLTSQVGTLSTHSLHVVYTGLRD